MKKAGSIFVALLVLMNTMGYYGIFFGLEYRNAMRMVSDFDHGTYDISQSVVIKLPIIIPYGNDSHSFQRVDGTFEYRGEFYRLIKQRLYRDTLHVVCIKDDRHKAIHNELVRYTETFGDHGNGVTKTIDFNKDYLSQTTNISHASEGWQVSLNRKPVILKLPASSHRDVFAPPKHG